MFVLGGPVRLFPAEPPDPAVTALADCVRIQF
jgi:hypothetical protein